MDHKAKQIDINTLKPFKGNPRRGNIEVLRESLRMNGQYRPVVVRINTNEILAGNHTWIAAKKEGWTKLWATFIECDDQTAKRINLVDNRAPELGGYDGDDLLAMLKSVPDLQGTGWTTEDMQALLFKVNPPIPDGPQASSSGDDDPDPPSTQQAVLLLCTDELQQSRLAKALTRAKMGDEAPIKELLQKVTIKEVTV